jgi:hypothetical protein
MGWRDSRPLRSLAQENELTHALSRSFRCDLRYDSRAVRAIFPILVARQFRSNATRRADADQFAYQGCRQAN